jgi:ATP-GRASP peptide maturase of grasp-with-spasm system
LKNNKLVIFSSLFDKTTDIIVSYLLKQGVEFHRVSKEDIFKSLTLKINCDDTNNMILQSKDKILEIDKNTILFYRRDSLVYEIPISKDKLDEDFSLYLKQEISFLRKFFFSKIKSIGSFINEVENNKLNNLFLASKLGINVPETIVTTSKNEIQLFFNKYRKCISKPIHNRHSTFINSGKTYEPVGLLKLNKNKITKLSNFFSPSLVQRYIEKEFEIRVFFFKGNFYSMAIFSQLDKKTKLDFRNYNNERPNRCIPYKLPINMENLLKNLINDLGLDTCSIDIVLCKKTKKYYFLEINPTGQFGWVSTDCNYYLEKIIADFITKLCQRK